MNPHNRSLSLLDKHRKGREWLSTTEHSRHPHTITYVSHETKEEETFSFPENVKDLQQLKSLLMSRITTSTRQTEYNSSNSKDWTLVITKEDKTFASEIFSEAMNSNDRGDYDEQNVFANPHHIEINPKKHIKLSEGRNI